MPNGAAVEEQKHLITNLARAVRAEALCTWNIPLTAFTVGRCARHPKRNCKRVLTLPVDTGSENVREKALLLAFEHVTAPEPPPVTSKHRIRSLARSGISVSCQLHRPELLHGAQLHDGFAIEAVQAGLGELH